MECFLNLFILIEVLVKCLGKYYFGFFSVVVKDILVSSVVYDFKIYQNYIFKVVLGSCVFWLDKYEMWIIIGCWVGVQLFELLVNLFESL